MRSLSQLEAILDSVPSLVAYVGADERNGYVNAAATRWLGRAPADVEGLSVRELLGERGYATVRHHIRSALHGQAQTFERPMHLADGRVVDSLTSYLPQWRDDRPDGFTVLVTDVSAQVRAENAHLQARRQTAEVVSRSHEAAGVTDDVLQELFAISLHLERLRQFPDSEVASAEVFLEPLSNTIEQLRAAIRLLTRDRSP